MAAKIYPNMVEDKMPNRYAQSWGVLCHRYQHAGSGWWRNRFPFTAMAGSILYGDPVEMAPLGGPYMTPLHAIEEMTTSQLRALADHQRDYLVDKTWSKEQYIGQLTTIMEQFKATGHVGDRPDEKPIMPPPRTFKARTHLANTPPIYDGGTSQYRPEAEPSAVAGGSGLELKVNDLGRRIR
jgi:hypothetical protein